MGMMVASRELCERRASTSEPGLDRAAQDKLVKYELILSRPLPPFSASGLSALPGNFNE